MATTPPPRSVAVIAISARTGAASMTKIKVKIIALITLLLLSLLRRAGNSALSWFCFLYNYSIYSIYTTSYNIELHAPALQDSPKIYYPFPAFSFLAFRRNMRLRICTFKTVKLYLILPKVMIFFKKKMPKWTGKLYLLSQLPAS
jgi:hypothetical protein